MAIKRRKVGNRWYLYEYRSIREGKKVRSEYVRYIGPEEDIKAGKKPQRALDRLERGPTTRAGAVRVLWSLCEDLGIPTLIDRICGPDSGEMGASAGQLLSMWAINRVLDADSVTQLVPWLATTDLPELTGVPADEITRDWFHKALDRVVRPDVATGRMTDHTVAIERALYERWRERHPLARGQSETVAYDLTSVMFFGVTCPLAELGYNAKKKRQQQINLALVVSRHDRMPMLHLAFPGNRNGALTVRNMLGELAKAKVKPGLLIWDRGNMGADQVADARAMKWHILGGVSRSNDVVRETVSSTDVPTIPSHYVRDSRVGMIYAQPAYNELYGERRRLIVYMNDERALRDRSRRNRRLDDKRKALDQLALDGEEWDEGKLREKIKTIVGSDGDLIKAGVRRKGLGPRVRWEFPPRANAAASREDGKWLLLCTDEKLDWKEAVSLYLDKDFVEKSFRFLKTDLDIEPVRHRLEHRVRAYLFVSVLAHWLWSALRCRLVDSGVPEAEVAKYSADLMRSLDRVERMEVRLKNERRTWYLNVTTDVKKGLRKLKMNALLDEEVSFDQPT